jgi:predicted nucleotidyltransferase
MSPRSLSTPLSIGDALFGKTRQAVLGLLFGRAGRSYHVREIVAVTGYGSAQVQRELARLVECGLVTRTPSGRRVLYKVNRKSHACEDVTHLVVGTFGMADLLRAALSPVADRIDLAMIVGPAARGEYVGLPDVELVVVGILEASDLAPSIRNAERAIARRIAVTLLDRATFAQRRRERARALTGAGRGRHDRRRRRREERARRLHSKPWRNRRRRRLRCDRIAVDSAKPRPDRSMGRSPKGFRRPREGGDPASSSTPRQSTRIHGVNCSCMIPCLIARGSSGGLRHSSEC